MVDGCVVITSGIETSCYWNDLASYVTAWWDIAPAPSGLSDLGLVVTADKYGIRDVYASAALPSSDERVWFGRSSGTVVLVPGGDLESCNFGIEFHNVILRERVGQPDSAVVSGGRCILLDAH